MTNLQLRELSTAFGTEITGFRPDVDLLDPDICARLQSLFDARGVLVFRDLDIDQTTQANVIRMLIGLGPLGPDESPTGRSGGDPYYVSNKEPGGGAPYGRLLFHSDMMWSEQTFRVLSLYGVEVEQPASPTLFASGVQAWASLPDDLRARVDGLTALQGHEEGSRAGDDPDVLVSTFENLPTRITPIAYEHPRTGDTVLYVSQQMTQAIVELPHAESEELLEALFEHLYRADTLYEHDWREQDLVAWDNIAMQHARRNVALEGPVRTLRKVFAPIPVLKVYPSIPTFTAARDE